MTETSIRAKLATDWPRRPIPLVDGVLNSGYIEAMKRRFWKLALLLVVPLPLYGYIVEH